MSAPRPAPDWLGAPNKYGEFVGFVCPRCGERRTHATPAVNLWRCWPCDRFESFDKLLRLPRRVESAPSDTQARTPRRRTINLDVLEDESA